MLGNSSVFLRLHVLSPTKTEAMKERSKGFISQEFIDHDSEIFDYIAELHSYLWRMVRAVNPGASGNLKNYVDSAIEQLETVPNKQ